MRVPLPVQENSGEAALVAVADEVAPPIEDDGVAAWIENHIDLFGAER